MQVPEDTYRRLADAISSDSSPVGIDAKHTHILILHQLEQIQQQLERLEQRLAELEDAQQR